MMKTWWLSFADSNRPEGEQFLGACIVDASDMASAIYITHTADINPGGEVKIGELPFQVPFEYKDRLFDKEEAVRLSNTLDWPP